MKSNLLLLSTLYLMLLASCNENQTATNPSNDSAGLVHVKTTEELKNKLQQIELKEPEKYLSLSDVTIRDSMLLVVKPSLFTHSKYAKVGSLIEGTVKCSSNIAKYKDLVITVSFYSQTETLIGSKDFTIYEYYKPNSEKRFQLHVGSPEGWKNFSTEIKSATGVE